MSAKKPKITILGDAPLVDVGRLRPHPMNDNRESNFVFGKLVATIVRDGFAAPITVRSGDAKGRFKDGHLEILGGEHRHRAAEKLGMPQVPVHDLGCVDDVTAKKLLINLNKVRGESDQDALSALLRDLHASEGEEVLESLAIDEDTLADLLDGESELGTPVDAGDGEMGDGDGSPRGDADAPKAAARDLLMVLELVRGVKQEHVERLVAAARRWAATRADRSLPPHHELAELLEREADRR